MWGLWLGVRVVVINYPAVVKGIVKDVIRQFKALCRYRSSVQKARSLCRVNPRYFSFFSPEKE